jgi:hypothetical protein
MFRISQKSRSIKWVMLCRFKRTILIAAIGIEMSGQLEGTQPTCGRKVKVKLSLCLVN